MSKSHAIAGNAGSADTMYHIVTVVIAAMAAALAMTIAQPPLEDEPGWNCATMGNHICGEVSYE